MENHTGQSGNFPKEDPPLKLIVDLCSHLADMGLEFQISLKIKDSLQFSLRSDNKASGQSAGGRDDEERVTAGDKCGGEQLIWKRKGIAGKGGEGCLACPRSGPNTDTLERRSERIGG